MKRQSDAVIHPPSGSEVPGKVDINPYVHYPPDDLRTMLEANKMSEDELIKVESALRQWERIYQWPGYYWKRAADKLRYIAYHIKLAELLGPKKFAEIVGPAQNLFYYQDTETPSGTEEIIDDIQGLYDQYNMPRKDIPRQGERPDKDIPMAEGDFSGAKDPIMTDVKPRGSGSDPDGMDYNDPPTGGDIEGWPDSI